jgi:hypothetical protein
MKNLLEKNGIKRRFKMGLSVIEETLTKDLDFVRSVYIKVHGLVWFGEYQEISKKYKDYTIEEIFNLYNSIAVTDEESELFKAIMYDYLDNTYKKIKEEIKMRTNLKDRLHTYSDVQEEIRDWSKELGSVIINTTFDTEKTKEEIEKECHDRSIANYELFNLNLGYVEGAETTLDSLCEYMDKLTDYYNNTPDTNYTEKVNIIHRAMDVLDTIGELVEEKELDAINKGMEEA